MNKTISIFIVVLLVVLICVQLLAWLARPPLSSECIKAMQVAAEMNPERIFADYHRAAYEQAETIYQQQFVAQEYAFLTLQAIAAQNIVLVVCGK